MDIIVDFQAFKDNCNKFIVKECAVTSPDYPFFQHWIIASPYDIYTLTSHRRKEAIWLQLNYHGIKWSDGGIKYSAFIKELQKVCSNGTRVFGKGSEKCNWLKDILNINIVNLEEFNVTRFKNLIQTTYMPVLRCFYHCKDKKHICALTNAYKLKLWMVANSHVF